MNVTGKAKVFAKDIDTRNGMFTAYSISIGSKEQDGDWINAYIPARFRKGVTVENGSTIDVKEGFLTVQRREDYNRAMIMVMDFVVLERGNLTNDKSIDRAEKNGVSESESPTGSGFAAIVDDDIPF